MFGFHAPELILLLVVALVIFGPKRLPEIGSSLGKGIREFRKSTSEPELEDKRTGRDVHIPDHEVHETTPVRDHEVTPTSPTRDRDAG